MFVYGPGRCDASFYLVCGPSRCDVFVVLVDVVCLYVVPIAVPCVCVFQESYTYRDPITEFLECLYVNFDFDGAQQKLRDCEKVGHCLQDSCKNTLSSAYCCQRPVTKHKGTYLDIALYKNILLLFYTSVDQRSITPPKGCLVLCH